MNRTNIQEANKHLQALYQRVEQLERICREQSDILVAKDSFIQTKIKELSAQDLLIQELQSQLQEKTSEVLTRNSEIEHLKSELAVRNSENSVLRERGNLLDSMLSLVPDLNQVVLKMDTIVSKSKDLGSYVEVSGSSSTAEDGDATVTIISNKENMKIQGEIEMDQLTGTDLMSTRLNGNENVHGHSPVEDKSVAEMARNFVHTTRINKFSVSDVNSEEENENLAPQRQKEMYF